MIKDRHCERNEAIQRQSLSDMDRFVLPLLTMTTLNRVSTSVALAFTVRSWMRGQTGA
jgi:hypothetical protein